jgi:periplasmic protein TonB
MRARPRLSVVVSLPTPRPRSTRFVTGSIAVHGALLAGIFIVPATRHRATPIDDAMVVSLAGPIGASETQGAIAVSKPAVNSPPAPKVKPPPTPAAPPKEARAVREVPIPKPKAKLVKMKPEPEKLPEHEAFDAPPSEGPSTPPTPPSATPKDGKPGEAAGPAVGAVTATVGGGDNALGWYGAAVKAALESAWIKPYLEDAQGTVSVVVAFDIARDGTTRNLRIQQSSGIPSLDRSAQRAVIEASPFPMIPSTWTEDTVPVTMRFDLSPEPR